MFSNLMICLFMDGSMESSLCFRCFYYKGYTCLRFIFRSFLLEEALPAFLDLKNAATNKFILTTLLTAIIPRDYGSRFWFLPASAGHMRCRLTENSACLWIHSSMNDTAGATERKRGSKTKHNLPRLIPRSLQAKFNVK